MSKVVFERFDQEKTTGVFYGTIGVYQILSMKLICVVFEPGILCGTLYELNCSHFW